MPESATNGAREAEEVVCGEELVCWVGGGEEEGVGPGVVVLPVICVEELGGLDEDG